MQLGHSNLHSKRQDRKHLENKVARQPSGNASDELKLHLYVRTHGSSAVSVIPVT
jgi:hypothetical protein